MPRLDYTVTAGECVYLTDKDLYFLSNRWYGETDPVYFTPEITVVNKSDENVFWFGTSVGNEIRIVLSLGKTGMAHPSGTWTATAPEDFNPAFQKITQYQYLTMKNVNDGVWNYQEDLLEGSDLYSLSIFEDMMDSKLVLVQMDGVYGLTGLNGANQRVLNYFYDRLAAPNCELGVFQPFSNPQNNMILEGWHPVESWGRWCGANEAPISIRLSAAPAKDLILKLDMQTFYEGRPIKVFVNGTELADFTTSTQIEQYEVKVPASILKNGTELDLVLKMDGEVFSPQSLGVSQDARPLGMGISGITVEEEQ